MNNNQPIIIKNSQQSNIPNITTTQQQQQQQPLVRLLNNPQINDSIKYHSVPMTRKNYTYMANVNIPSVTHIIAPANNNNTNNNQPILPQVNSMKLPRVLPPPNNSSYYTTSSSSTTSNIPISSATSGVLSSRGSSCIGTPKLIQRRESFIPIHDTSSPIYKRDSISPSLPPFKSIDSNSRRHSVSLAVLDDPLQSIKQQQHNTINAIIKVENKDLSVPLVQIKSENDLDNELPKNNSLLHNVGERYNDKGELIGRSGKILRDTKRAAQNRCAQKAFRIRREKYIKNLEIKSKEFDGIVSENNQLKLKIQELEKILQSK